MTCRVSVYRVPVFSGGRRFAGRIVADGFRVRRSILGWTASHDLAGGVIDPCPLAALAAVARLAGVACRVERAGPA